MFWNYLLLGIHVAISGYVLYVFYNFIPKPVKKFSKPHPMYTDYTSPHTNLIIRVFPPNYDVEAMEGVKPSQIVFSGSFSSIFMYYLIEKDAS